MKLFTLILFLSLNTLATTPRLSDEAVAFKTQFGDLIVAFYPDQAPQHTEQILKLVRGGIYSNTLFFRTEKGFVTQVENYNARTPPLTPEELKLIKKIPGEFNSIPHKRGILSMARFDDPNSAESSFSFLLGDAPHLNNQYTAFGEVIQNIHILEEIEKLPPKSVYITSAEVISRKDLATRSTSSPLNWINFRSTTVQIVLLTLLSLLGIGIFRKIVK